MASASTSAAIAAAAVCITLALTITVIAGTIGILAQVVCIGGYPGPAGIPIGTTIWSQSASLIAPNSLPNGQNAFGLTTSNGVETFISIN